MALSLAPLFMGDTLQVFCLSHWKLTNTQVSRLFTGVAIQGVIANTLSATLIKRLGLQLFTLLCTGSTLLFWAGFSTGVPREDASVARDVRELLSSQPEWPLTYGEQRAFVGVRCPSTLVAASRGRVSVCTAVSK